MNQGLVSLFIPIVVIILAMTTKRIITALVVGIIAGGILLAGGNIIKGCILAIEHLVKSASGEESVYIIMFLFLFGAFGEIMKLSGGIKGFSVMADKYVKTEKGALASVWIVTIFTFIDCCFHAIATGTVGKALVEKTKGSKEKLAVVVNVTSCLLIILIPFGTTYVGYIIGVINSALNKAGVSQSAYNLYIKSVPFNFYAIVMILVSIGIILFNLRFDSIFLIGCAASYFMGSAWGTWALLMPIAVPLAITTQSNLPLVLGAVLAGGSLGDNASPLGETAILSSTIAEVPLMKHVKTILPYSIASIIISSILFIVFTFIK